MILCTQPNSLEYLIQGQLKLQRWFLYSLCTIVTCPWALVSFAMHFGCVVVHAVCDTWAYFVCRTTPLLSYGKASLVSLKSSFKKSQSYIFKNMGPQSGTTFIGHLSVMYLGTHASPFTLSWAKKIYDFKFCPLLCFCSFFPPKVLQIHRAS